MGTYTIAGIQTRLGGASDPRIGSAALTGTLPLNANGSGSLTINGDGALLRPFWTLSPSTLGNGNPGTTFSITWTYANGVLTPTLVEFGQGPGINVGPGGRLLVTSIPEFSAPDSRADVSLLIFSRLQ